MPGLIDNDFVESDEDEFSQNNLSEIGEKPRRMSQESEVDLGDEPPKPEPKKEKEDVLEIDVVSDAPEKDKDKWVATGDEDLPKEEDNRDYGKKVRKRLDDLTAKTHAERRRAEELQRQLEEALGFAETQRKRANDLSALVENGEKTLVDEHKTRLTRDMDAAKAAFRAAHDAGDGDGMAAAQESIARTGAALRDIERYQPKPLARTEEYKPTVQQVQTPQVDEATKDWQSKNTWFGVDDRMTNYAMSVHNDLIKQGHQPLSNPAQYWKALDKEMKTRFPEKYEQPRARQPQQPIVAAANRQQGGPVKRVTLTESQVKIAKRLGLTPEQYAREALKLQG